MNSKITLVSLLATSLIVIACRKSSSPVIPVSATSTLPPMLPEGMTPVATSEAAAIRPHMPDEFSTPVPWNSDFTPRPDPTYDPSAPTPAPFPTVASQYPSIEMNVNLPYLQDGGVLPTGALARIGIGDVYELNLLDNNQKMLLETAAGLYMYDTATFDRIWRRYLDQQPWDVVVSPDGRRLIAEFGWDGNPVMYEAGTGNLVAELPGWNEASWSPHSTLVAVEERPVSDEGPFTARINLYNGTSGEQERVVEAEIDDGFWGAVFSVMLWSPDGSTLAACGDKGIYLWDAGTAAPHVYGANSRMGGLYMRSCSMSFSPDGTYLLVEDANSTWVIDIAAGESAKVIQGGVWDIAWHDNLLYILNPDELRAFDTSTWEEVSSTSTGGQAFTWSEEQTRVALVDDNGFTVLTMPGYQASFSVSLPTHYVKWSPGERWLMHIYDDHYTLFDASTGEQISAPMQPDGGMEFIDDDRLIVYHHKQMMIINPNDLSLTAGWRVGLTAKSLAWSTDGTTLCITDDQDFTWQWSEQTDIVEQAPCADTSGPNIAVRGSDWQQQWVEADSPDGTMTARAENNTGCGDGPFGGGCGVWGGGFTIFAGDEILYQERASEEERWGSFGTSALAWSLDGTLLALAQTYGDYSIDSQSILILNPRTGERILELKGHLAPASTLLFSPDGTRLASVSDDGTIIIWSTTH
jgi:WD40 repeat protein